MRKLTVLLAMVMLVIVLMCGALAAMTASSYALDGVTDAGQRFTTFDVRWSGAYSDWAGVFPPIEVSAYHLSPRNEPVVAAVWYTVNSMPAANFGIQMTILHN